MTPECNNFKWHNAIKHRNHDIELDTILPYFINNLVDLNYFVELRDSRLFIDCITAKTNHLMQNYKN